MGDIYQSVVLSGKKDIRVDALMDGGVSTTYIKDSLVDKLGYTRVGKERIMLGNGKFITGHRVPIVLKVRGRVKAVRAVAIDMPENLILGHDFFQDNNVILDYKNHRFKFSERVPKTNRRLRL